MKKSAPRITLADIKTFCMGGVLTGHVKAVASNYLEIFKGHANICIAGGPAYAEKFPQLVCLSHNVKAESSVLLNKLRELHNMWQLFSRCKEDIIVLQSSAVATTFLGIALFCPRCSALYMIQYNTAAISSTVKKFLFSRAKKYINGIICPNEGVGRAYALPYCVVPDYVYTGTHLEESLSYREKKYDFCMLGCISPDKGMVEVAAKLAGLPYRVIIAGNPSSIEIEQQLKTIADNADNIELRLHFLDEAEYSEILRASRFGILNYSGAYSEHSSGVVYDMLFAGLPIFGTHCKSLQIIEDYGMGQLFDNLTKWDVSALPDEKTYNQYLDNIHRYYKTHELSRLKLINFISEHA